MTKVYACLLGDWVCLNDDPDCKIGNYVHLHKISFYSNYSHRMLKY